MSTTLTNGVIIPDNGSRNWGGDLANNWNIIDLNIGYMNDVKNRVTTLETSVTENTANIQNNASNISALQTSKQDAIEDLETIRAGANAGATAVQPSTLSNYVDLSSEQVINGAKTFSSMLTTSATVALLGTSTDKYLSIQSGGVWNNGARISLYSKEHTENSGQFEIVTFNTENKANGFTFSTDGVIPISVGGTLNLGTSTNKWKTFNGVNPGALSLPDYSQSVTLSFAINSPMEIPFDGFIKISFNVSNYSYFSISVNDQEAYIGQSAMKPTVSAFIPVSQNDVVKIQVVDGEYTGFGNAVLFKNKGNV